ncbi:homocysteine S-methyltransferase-like [Sitodiplosis mosellana]|uniref:homocysteine S-methyltransferase-like n=1 Tax=Sitodiplosis mosellana TaxID=263140 RepID=UPI002444816A|nr:homocysteine S-methyltransferase-like [Sitodiplosis mosellana]XP_055309840.1 homocysteine S-methyltransferase-like [Sitodiplosis mosellana]
MSIEIKPSPLTDLLAVNGLLVIDGAMGTELEVRGCNLNDKLWSAKVLLENPELIYQVHLDYFRVGADFVITSSYQASVAGFARRGLNEQQALALIAKSVELAKQARTDYLNELKQAKTLLIAGSVGPYATLLADGSEYRGDYQLLHDEFAAYHRPRIQALVEAGVDFLCIETIPSVSEVQSQLKLLTEFPTMTACITFSLRDTEHLCDGTPLSAIIDQINAQPQVVAIGVNCIALEKVTGALKTLRRLTDRPLLVYPNSGEQYDPITKTWISRNDIQSLVDHIDEWLEAGAKMIGGCCRTGPQDIQQIAAKLKQRT